MALNNKGWYECPACGKKLLKVSADSILYGTPIYCRKCKVEWFPAIYAGQELDDDTPFPVNLNN